MNKEELEKLKDDILKMIKALGDDKYLEGYFTKGTLENENFLTNTNCKTCDLSDTCVYTTDVIPKSHKAYWCEEAKTRYLQMFKYRLELNKKSHEEKSAESRLHDLLHQETSLEDDRPRIRKD